MNSNRIRKQLWRGLVGVLLGGLALVACVTPAQTPVERTVAAILTSAQPTLTTPAHTPPPTTSRPTRPIAPEMLTETALAHITPLPSLTPTLAPAHINDLHSPDGQWTARWSWQDLHATANSPAEYRIIVKVFKRNGAAEWILEDQTGQGLGYGTTRFVRWSSDSRYIYFDSIWVADGGCAASALGGNLKRLDVTDGSMTPIGDGSGYAFAPDGKQVAYYRYAQAWMLVVHDLETGAERQTKLDLGKLVSLNTQPGLIAWASDGQAVAFALIAGNVCEGQVPASVWRVDLPALTARVIYTSEHTVHVARWPEPEKIALSDDWFGREFWINAVTGEVIPRLAGEWASPDEQWAAQLWTATRPDTGQVYTQFKVFKSGGSVEWVVIDKWTEDGLGFPWPAVAHWSHDGRSMYVADYAFGDGCPVFHSISAVREIDLETGQVTDIIPYAGSALAFSSDETQLAYGTFTVRDLITGLERYIPIEPTSLSDVGEIVWSPDGRAVMLTVLASELCANELRFSIVRVEADTLAQTTLVNADARQFFVVEWPASNRVVLRDKDGTTWWMDATTGELLLSATPTPGGD